MEQVGISVIISTYNAVEWLKKTLAGYEVQSFSDFEIVIADDGSKGETKSAIEEFKLRTHFPVTHVWQEDMGFQKTKILNKALLACKGKYIIMSDGDCIPRNDFVAVHNANKKIGYFLSGGYFKLPMNISNKITLEDIHNQHCFDIKWLKANGLGTSIKNHKLSSGGIKSTILNQITPTNASWNGHNASGWKKDIFEVNGFDERMRYGGEDRELGERLINSGVKSKQIRYSAICVHLDHSRNYVDKKAIDENYQIRKETKINKSVRTNYGIQQSIPI